MAFLDDFAIITGSPVASPIGISKFFATNAAMSNKWLEEQGLVVRFACYSSMQPGLVNIKFLWCKAQGYI